MQDGTTTRRRCTAWADLHFEPLRAGAATRLSFRAHGQPTGPQRLLQPLLARTLRKQFADDCATLKRVLETG